MPFKLIYLKDPWSILVFSTCEFYSKDSEALEDLRRSLISLGSLDILSFSRNILLYKIVVQFLSLNNFALIHWDSLLVNWFTTPTQIPTDHRRALHGTIRSCRRLLTLATERMWLHVQISQPLEVSLVLSTRVGKTRFFPDFLDENKSLYVEVVFVRLFWVTFLIFPWIFIN